MASRDGVDPRGEGAVEEISEHRRSRLWLGYSEDNLRGVHNSQRPRAPIQAQETVSASNSQPALQYQHDQSQEDDSIPYNYHNLSELAAPSPVEDLPRKRKQSYLEERATHAGSGVPVPDDFQNLDGTAASPPIKEPQKERKHEYLQHKRGNSDPVGSKGVLGNFEYLDEFPVPKPVLEPPNGRQNGHSVDAESKLPATDHERMGKDLSPPRQNVSKLTIEVYTISHLIFFSILGTLARLGLQALTFYPGAPVQTGLLWANVGGSLIMGFLAESRELFCDKQTSPLPEDSKDKENGRSHQRRRSADAKHTALEKSLPLYIGLATGFCGSFTSFSSFMRDAYFALANALPVPIQHPSSAPISQTINVHRNPGYSFLAVVAVLIITVGLSLMALKFGAHVALFLVPYIPSAPFLFTRSIIDRSVVFLAWGSWLAAIFMAIWPPDRPGGPVGNASWAQETWRSQALFALVFAPLGCLLRFYASTHLNGRIKNFPLGTFAVNIFGTALEAMLLDLQRVPVGGMVGCQVLQGIFDGFCGCLTTVSTWVAELTALRLRHAYLYGLMSVAISLSLLVIITGSLQWTRGFAHPLCTT